MKLVNFDTIIGCVHLVLDHVDGATCIAEDKKVLRRNVVAAHEAITLEMNH